MFRPGRRCGARSRLQRVTSGQVETVCSAHITLLTANPADHCLRTETVAFRREGLVCAPGRSEETGHEHLRFDHEQDLPPWVRIRQSLGWRDRPAGGECRRAYDLLGRCGID